MRYAIVLLTLSTLYSSSSFALFKGRPAAYSEQAALVTLHLRDADFPEYDYFCSGVLIGPTKVLTAGHCVSGMGWEAYEDYHILLYNPQLVMVDHMGKTQIAKSIDLAPNYFESPGYESEDLAIIELEKPFPGVLPISLASKADLKAGMEVTMVAQGLSATTTLDRMVQYPVPAVLFTSTKRTAICQGDSGGALLIKKNGQHMLAGILIYEGEEECNLSKNYSYFPRVQF